jgi:hypothetical protein
LVLKYCLNYTLGIGFVLLLILFYLIYRIDFRENDRNSFGKKGISFVPNSNKRGKGIVDELGNAYGE